MCFTCHEITRERVLLGSETDCQSIFNLKFELLKTWDFVLKWLKKGSSTVT